jgi:hypothetical protein
MSEYEHDHAQLGAYTLGVLEPDEVQAVDAHLAACAECRRELAEIAAMKDLLGEVPPEAFLDGPPDSDILLQRTLRQVRTERARSGRFRTTLVAAGVVAFAAATMAAGVLVGRQTAPTIGAEPPPPVPSATSAAPTVSPPAPTPSGVRTLTGTDPVTGATMTVALTPAAGWVRVHANVGGIPAGKQCVLQVVPAGGGAPVTAGSWLVSPKGEKDGTVLDGSALVAPDKIGAVQVVTVQGQKLISVSV